MIIKIGYYKKKEILMRVLKTWIKEQKALEEEFTINHSKNNQIIYRWSLFQTTKKKYATNKTDVYHIDDFWSLDIVDLKDYGPENIRGYRYVWLS